MYVICKVFIDTLCKIQDLLFESIVHYCLCGIQADLKWTQVTGAVLYSDNMLQVFTAWLDAISHRVIGKARDYFQYEGLKVHVCVWSGGGPLFNTTPF